MHYYKIAIIGSPLGEFTYHFDTKIPIGTKVTFIFNNRQKEGVVLSFCEQPAFETSEIVALTDSYFSNKQMELAHFLSSYYLCSLGEAYALMVAFVGDGAGEIPGQARNDEGTILNDEGMTLNDGGVLNDGSVQKSSSIHLSEKQSEALAFLKRHKVSLLFGDTGSGKTEIYMKAFEQMIEQGKRSLFLMPEISLTPQMSLRLAEHFGEHVIMWHSKLTPKQKSLALEKLHSGEAMIIAGARSALFLPVENLGLIVVDEEHDDSYKSSSRPRYNARDIAIYMGQLYGVGVILGSATPSLSSYVKFPHFRLKGGHFESERKFIFEKSAESLSHGVVRELNAVLEKKEQAIVFLPTRANFKYLICGDCGHTYECVFCSVGMSLHQNTRAMKCHYCNFTQAIPQVCPKCHSHHLVSSRLGTAEAAKEISDHFSDARVEQFDRDVITTQKKLTQTLKRFNDKEIDILVGTQMLSKGHDYHGVTLAVVLGMDNMLTQSDYRAREKALASLIQVAGRSGRLQDGRVYVQSFHESFFSAYVENYEAFLEEEKRFRDGLYPPYKKLCRVLFADKNATKALNAMNLMHERLVAFGLVEIVGFGKCALERVADRYRYEILLRSDKSTDIIKAITATRVPMAVIDMDPIEFG